MKKESEHQHTQIIHDKPGHVKQVDVIERDYKEPGLVDKISQKAQDVKESIKDTLHSATAPSTNLGGGAVTEEKHVTETHTTHIR